MSIVPEPMFISSRLMAALKLADGSTVHVGAVERDSEDRVAYEWAIDGPDGKEIATGADLRSGCGADVDYGDAMATFLSFISACSDSLRYPDGEHRDLFAESAHEWIAEHGEECEMLAYELENPEED